MKQFIANMTISKKILLISLVTIVFLVCGYVAASFITSRPLSVVVMIIAIGLSLFVANRMTKTILAPVRKIAEAIEGMSKGDLTRRIEVIRKDEIGDIATHFNTFAEKLWNTILQFSKGSIVASGSATLLDNAAKQMTSGMERAVVQVNSVASASEEMSMTSSEIAMNCVSASKSSEKANSAATAGETIINETVAVMDRINEYCQGLRASRGKSW